MRFRATTVLVIILCAVSCVIVLGTAIAFTSRKAEPGIELRHSEKMPTPTGTKKGGTAYMSLGQMRAGMLPVSQNSDDMVIVTPWFSYASADSAFGEELFQKTRKIRTIVTDYFSSHTKNALLKMGENEVKRELIQNINNELMLGAIENLYFDDYIFFSN